MLIGETVGAIKLAETAQVFSKSELLMVRNDPDLSTALHLPRLTSVHLLDLRIFSGPDS